MREPLLTPLAALAAGIIAGRIFPVGVASLAWGLAALAVLGLALLAWRRRNIAIAAALATLALAGALVDRLHAPGPRPFIDAKHDETVLVTGCVVEPPVFSESRSRFVVELDRRARAQASMYLDAGEEPPALRYGHRVELTGRVRTPRNFRNPGSFDYVNYLERQEIYWTISLSSADAVRILPGECGSPVPAVLFAVRTAALDRLDRLFAAHPNRLAMFRAILIGEDASVERIWQDQFRRTGTYHTLVISGLHLTVLAGCFLFLLRVVGCGPGWALWLTCLVGWTYAGVTGWHTPAIRAAAGLTLYLTAGFFYRRRRLLNILAAIAIVFLLADPDQLFDPSFHMSFLAVAAIGAFAVPALEKTSQPYRAAIRGLRDPDRGIHLPPRAAQFRLELRLLAETVRLLLRIPESWSLTALGAVLRGMLYAWDLLAVSAVIQAALLLPMAVYFHRLSLTGLVANPVIVFLTTLAVPAGFLALVTGWSPIVSAAGAVIGASMKMAAAFSAWEPGWRVPDPPGWLSALLLGALVALGVSLRLFPRWRVSAFALCAMASLVLAVHPFPPEAVPGSLEMSVVDVGQGEGIVLALPAGQRMLIDGGGIPVFPGRPKPRLEIGEDVVSPYLWSRSIRSVDVVVATHGHEDHIGGLPALIENFRPHELWMSGRPDGEAWGPVREAAHRHGVRIVRLRAGEKRELGGARITALAPPPDYVFRDRPANNDSLVLRVAYGDRSLLVTGDIERSVERWLVATGGLQPADVLMVPHHGSRTSSSEGLIAAVAPSYAIISAGFQNSYGFPHPDVTERLRAHGAAVLRTDLDGLITVRTDGKQVWVNSRRDQPAWFQRRSAFPSLDW